LHEGKRHPQFGPDAREPDPDQLVGSGQDERASARAFEDPKLVSERENLEVQCRARRIKERSERSTDTTIGIAEPRLFDGDQNLNESARTGFLVGTARR
jgi:hypothetical protein